MNVQSGALSCAVQGGAREMEDKGKVKEAGDLKLLDQRAKAEQMDLRWSCGLRRPRQSQWE